MSSLTLFYYCEQLTCVRVRAWLMAPPPPNYTLWHCNHGGVWCYKVISKLVSICFSCISCITPPKVSALGLVCCWSIHIIRKRHCLIFLDKVFPVITQILQLGTAWFGLIDRHGSGWPKWIALEAFRQDSDPPGMEGRWNLLSVVLIPSLPMSTSSVAKILIDIN